MQLIFISGSLRRSSLQVAFLAGSRNTFTQTFVLFPNIDNSLAYSENETVCGKWINGKSIYRKVISTTTPSQIDIATNLDVVSENLESLVKLSLIVENEDGYKYYGSSFINTANLIISVWINPSNQLRMMVNSDYFKSKPCIVIVEYTKKD